MSSRRGRGRPKGSKDGPRKEGAKQRGRPTAASQVVAPASASDYFPPSTSARNEVSNDVEYNARDQTGSDAARKLDEIETRAFNHYPPTTSANSASSDVDFDDYDSGGQIDLDAARELDEIETRAFDHYPPNTSANSESSDDDDDDDDDYDAGDEIDLDTARELDMIETHAFTDMQTNLPFETRESSELPAPSNPTPTPNLRSGPKLQALREASKRTCAQPFFSHMRTFAVDSDSEDGFDSQNDADDGDNGADGKASQNQPQESTKAWFKKPKYMSDSVYTYFGKVIGPIILKKNGQSLAKPESFRDTGVFTPASFWIHPPEPTILLSQQRFEPAALSLPRIFLWLPHFFVEILCCPDCGKPMEKNGALRPRRITDMDSSYYIITWSYYCRKGCKSHFHGWSHRLLQSLPSYLRLAFPAVLSRKAGLSHNVMSQLRVGNQHKMGPSGVCSLLFEMHTLRFNTIQAQWLEALFERVRGRHTLNMKETQLTLHSYFGHDTMGFGNFGDTQGYGGFVPSEDYLAEMMNKAIELDEPDANQHTACLAPDQIAIDDSHKVIKHIAKVNGVSPFQALWTCMTGRYIRAQVLAHTKAHEERIGPLTAVATSAKAYGFAPPAISYSDDPVKDRHLVYSAFPSLAENLTPISAAYGLQPLTLPPDVKTVVLPSSELVEGVAASMFATLDADPNASICMYTDFEWNVSRRVHKLHSLPASLLLILASNRVFKIGSAIKGDLTRLKKQFSQLSTQSSFTVIDLKEYAIERGVIRQKSAGSLDALLDKCLGLYLPKDDALRKHDGWETRLLPAELLDYAAKDVYASRLLFEKLTELSPIERVTSDTPGGTPVKILVQAGGEVAAYGHILHSQPSSLGTVRVAVPSKNRLVVEINSVIIPAASALLHLLPSPSGSKTQSGAYTLGQLQAASGSTHFTIVVPISLLEFSYAPPEVPSVSSAPVLMEQDCGLEIPSTSSALIPDAANSDDELSEGEPEMENVDLDMLEAHSAAASKDKGKQRELSTSKNIPSMSSPLLHLRTLIESPPDIDSVFQRLQKDIFHAFHMIPTPVNHGMRPAFLRALRDHLLRWDPDIRAQIDATCQRVFHMSFDEMLARNPRYIAARCPRHVPSPSILVPALEYVFGFFGPSLDAKTGQPLFSKLATQKAKAVVDLARQGYLSDIKGVVLYEKAGVDQHGLQIYRCLRGTNKVEGGPHGDIYRKFGALNVADSLKAGPRLTNNCLTDHRTWYNLQAFAQHIYGVDWEFHHQLGLINRTSFLLNYLSDFLEGARSYSGWINADLYERTNETFGVCAFPEPLRIRFGMEPYSQQMAELHKLNHSDDWLRRRQGLAFPAVPPSTPEARQYFFVKIREHASLASTLGRGTVNYELFANEWNSSADGKHRYYVTPEVLAAYSKSWEKASNIRASQELVSDEFELVQRSAAIFAAPKLSFPDFLEGLPIIDEPARGLVDFDNDGSAIIPSSISTHLPISQSLSTQIPPAVLTHELPPPLPSSFTPDIHDRRQMSIVDNRRNASEPEDDLLLPAVKRRRVELAPSDRKHKKHRSCRRCKKEHCPGGNNIEFCLKPCLVPCKKCGRSSGCHGVDGGRKCTAQA
ncbi:hypothetical protein FIBSPDRAFT_938563 [Athelia psychrophila]|uniref:3'-5' exonuclease n=1 Tax=Athelia psychrophila TaxID=1759441 RepID=A0A165Y7F0_9AGAM|nr:hypothetical protein FIBSPDRAFT_938563 [Fibularhizoctonia sp. CBS 109695]